MNEPNSADNAATVPQGPEKSAPSTWALAQTTDEFAAAESRQDGKSAWVVTSPQLVETPDAHKGEQSRVDPKASDLPQVDGYEVLQVLGRGGMGVVYRARDVALGRTVALKMLRAGALANHQEIQRFYREAQAAAQLNHPHLVPVYEVRQHRELHYFTMAFVSGGTLADHMDRFSDPKAAVALMVKVARAVHHAHRHHILHRDLKPSNVLLDEEGEPLVSDFGLAKMLDSALDLTQPGDMVGTPLYMAPEQATGRSDQASPASDIWALGVMLYEMLTGQRPFGGQNREELLREIQSTDPPRPRSVSSRLHTDLETICLKCLEKNPAHRYVSAEALADDLERWQAGEPILAKPAPWPRRWWRKVRRHPIASTVAIVLIVALAGGLAAQHLRNPDRELWDMQRTLARGEPVTLIGDKGRPRWLRWQTGEAGTGINFRDGSFYIQTTEDTLLELMPDPQVERYLFRAEIKHDSDLSHVGDLGLYFSHEKLHGPKGIADSFLALSFSDGRNTFKVSKDAKGQVYRRAALRYRYYREPLVDFGLNVKPPIIKPGQGALIDYLPPGPDADPAPWRPLAVEVTPERVRVYWNYQLFADMTRADIETCANASLSDPDIADETKDLSFRFNPRGGLGLYVARSTASFRLVAIEPLPAEN
jgi:serine/threonine-protein kinase